MPADSSAPSNWPPAVGHRDASSSSLPTSSLHPPSLPVSSAIDWAALSTNTINPTMFATLAANGLLPNPPRPSPAPWSPPIPAKQLQHAPRVAPSSHTGGTSPRGQRDLLRFPPLDTAVRTLPPSLWMSPTSASPPFATPAASNVHAGYDRPSPVPASATASTPKSPSISDILSDDFFLVHPGGPTHALPPPLMFPSPPHSTSSAASSNADAEDVSALAREDPLATQVWKMYARTKAGLPHAQRMENLTWRMMALALRRRREEEGRAATTAAKKKSQEAAAAADGEPKVKAEQANGTIHDAPHDESKEDNEPRGRRIDKGKTTKLRVEGFDDGKDEE